MLEVVQLAEAKRGVVPLPRRWVVAGSIAWASHIPPLTGDDER
jgi:hypothetical protein